MREIKFRGKLISGAGWAEGNFERKVGDKFTIITPDETPLGRYGAVEPETVGQYTGMTDNNGVEIYEGDVVDYRDEYGAIVFEDCEFLIQFEAWTAHLGEFYPRELEVIGNIHDHPGVIKGEKP